MCTLRFLISQGSLTTEPMPSLDIQNEISLWIACLAIAFAFPWHNFGTLSGGRACFRLAPNFGGLQIQVPTLLTKILGLYGAPCQVSFLLGLLSNLTLALLHTLACLPLEHEGTW